MEIEKLISHIRTLNQDIEELEGNIDDLFAENSALVIHVVENWTQALTLGFWKRLFKIRMKKSGLNKLAAKCLNSILSVNSPFVMNVSTLKTWWKDREYGIVTFSDNDIQHLYDTVKALEHDADFLDPLKERSYFHYLYFLTKIPYIKRQRAYFDGSYRPKDGPLEYPLLTDLVSETQPQINESIAVSAELGNVNADNLPGD